MYIYIYKFYFIFKIKLKFYICFLIDNSKKNLFNRILKFTYYKLRNIKLFCIKIIFMKYKSNLFLFF